MLKEAAERYGQPDGSVVVSIAPNRQTRLERPADLSLWLRAGYTGVHTLL